MHLFSDHLDRFLGNIFLICLAFVCFTTASEKVKVVSMLKSEKDDYSNKLPIN